MYGQSNTQLVTFQEWVLRIQPGTEKKSRLLVLIHGLTGGENSMWVFVRNFPKDYWIIAPRGPYIAENPDGGYSWWPIQAGFSNSQDANGETPTLEQLRPAADDLIALIDSYSAKNNIHATQFDLIGLSQGGVMSNTISILYPERTCRTAILASFIPPKSGFILQESTLKGKAFFVAHGILDEKVRVEHARRSVEMLESAGAQVTYCEDEVGHKLSVSCMRALERFFAS